jgi:glycerol-3-phosphate cytidylyltransferase-like family protein
MIRRREARHRERAGQAHHGDKPYMDTFEREDVLESVRYYRPIPHAKAVDMSFVKKAPASFKS